MCIATPLQVNAIDCESGLARCSEFDGQAYPQAIQTALLDQPPATGDWLLIHVDTAIRTLEADEAEQIANALAAVAAASRGDPFEHLLADLIDREPELPEHLR
jgi:hydrogenase expression/formation protein HypC